MRYGFRIQPAFLVRGSSRRIMFLRSRPAHISVIHRRARASAVIGFALARQAFQIAAYAWAPLRKAPRRLRLLETHLALDRSSISILRGTPLCAVDHDCVGRHFPLFQLQAQLLNRAEDIGKAGVETLGKLRRLHLQREIVLSG
jgi:hypothetical protein